ncbi:MAG: glutamate--cysteine ligase [Pseudomonadota bacterium]
MPASRLSTLVAALSQCRDEWWDGRLLGLEKESLRTSIAGTISQRDHPTSLGAALTHPHITTDFGEAMLEFVTPPSASAGEALRILHDLHGYTVGKLNKESLWAASMPCVLQGESSVRIGEYGPSNAGQMKHIYRRGLGLRYGKSMQVIAGIHINLSWPQAVWDCIADAEGSSPSARAQVDAHYMGLLRNVQRHGWLLLYLFGASPAICTSFLGGESGGLERFDSTTVYQPFGTSLRMSDLGYRNSDKAPVKADYNSLQAYVASLREAISTPWPLYEALGVMQDDAWQQLSVNMLQIENEYYSGTRPKQITEALEKPSTALARRGIAYVELRTLDVNPFAAVGIDLDTLRFVEVFALYCMLRESAPLSLGERARIDRNNDLVANQGRDPNLELIGCNNQNAALPSLANDLLDDMTPLAELYGDEHFAAVVAQRAKVADPDLTPSGQIIQGMREQRCGFFEFARALSDAHHTAHVNAALTPDRRAAFDQDVADSLAARDRIESAPQQPFATFISDYMSSE